MDLFAERARTFPLRRAGEAGEIVGAALYLASDASTYTTGTILTVDGGAQWSMAGTGEGGPTPHLKSLQIRAKSPHVMSKGPLWLRVVHRLERAVGEPVESAVRSRHVLRRGEQGHADHAVRPRAPRNAPSRRGLHLLNLPAGTDVKRHARAAARAWSGGSTS